LRFKLLAEANPKCSRFAAAIVVKKMSEELRDRSSFGEMVAVAER
jgi:hypothetical protein